MAKTLNEWARDIHQNAVEHDWCGKEGVDVEAVLAQKHEYNRTRPYRHGGKAL